MLFSCPGIEASREALDSREQIRFLELGVKAKMKDMDPTKKSFQVLKDVQKSKIWHPKSVFRGPEPFPKGGRSVQRSRLHFKDGLILRIRPCRVNVELELGGPSHSKRCPCSAEKSGLNTASMSVFFA